MASANSSTGRLNVQMAGQPVSSDSCLGVTPPPSVRLTVQPSASLGGHPFVTPLRGGPWKMTLPQKNAKPTLKGRFHY